MLISCWNLPAKCQSTAKIDSLNQLLRITNNKKQRVDLLNKLAETYLPANPEYSDSLVIQSIDLAENTAYEQGIMDGLFLSFKINKVLGNIDKALVSIRRLGTIQKENGNASAYASALVNEGNLLMKKQELKNSTEVLLKAIDIYKNIEGSDLSLLYTTLGQVNQIQGNYSDALAYYDMSLKINLEKKFDKGISANYVNIGNIYSDQEDYQKASEFYLKALEIKERMDDRQGIMKCLNNLGVSAMKLNDTKNALIYHQKALDFALGNKNEHDIAMCYINFGYDYLYANSFENAIKNASKGNEIALKINNISLLKESYLVLSESYAGKNNFNEAYKFHVLHKQYSDSLLKENNLKELTEIQTRYESVQKDNQIQELQISTADKELQLQHQKVYVIFFIGLLVVVTVLVLFFYLQNKNSRKIQAKLQEINDIKTAFFTNLSHEFRTPLTLMLGPAEKLLEKAHHDDKPLLQLIHRNASRLLALDEQLLNFTKIDSGNQKLHLVQGDITAIIAAITASFGLTAEKRNIQLNQHFPDAKINLLFDPDFIEKIVGNLISNAIKYTQKGGEVNVSISLTETSEINQWIRIDISDNGPGIPKEKQEQIFERFYQLSHYSDGSYDGYGIGLALVKELVLLHKGKIELLSKEGEGCKFSVYLSHLKDVYSAEELHHIQQYEPHTFPEIKVNVLQNKIDPAISTKDLTKNKFEQLILVVDDNPDMRTYLTEILKDNYRVSEAADGKEGLSIAIQQHPDLIVTDIMMETMDGIEFCKNLKINPKTQDIPVIMLTALTGVDDKVTGLENGADDYMEKPFSAKELIVRIKNLIAQRKFLKDLFTQELKIEPKAISITSAEAIFLNKLIGMIENHIDNPELEADFLAGEMGMSRSQLYRRITAVTKQSAGNFIKIIRIKRAAQMMEQRAGNISEIMYSVGFNNLSYFSKCFKEVYQMTPSEYLNLGPAEKSA